MSDIQDLSNSILSDLEQAGVVIVWLFAVPLLQVVSSGFYRLLYRRKKQTESDNGCDENSVSSNQMMHYVERISAQEFQKEGKQNAEYYLRQLFQTPEYQEFLKEKERKTKRIKITTYLLHFFGFLCAVIYFYSQWNKIKEIQTIREWTEVWSITNGILLFSSILSVSFQSFATEMSHSRAPKFSSRHWRPLIQLVRKSIGMPSPFIVFLYLTLTTVVMYFLRQFVPFENVNSSPLVLPLLRKLFIFILEFLGRVPLGLFIAFFGHNLLTITTLMGMILLHAVVLHYLCLQMWSFVLSFWSSFPHSSLLHFLFVYLWPTATSISFTPSIFSKLRHRLTELHIAYLTVLFVVLLIWDKFWQQFNQHQLGLLVFGFVVIFLGTVIYLFPKLMFKHFVIVTSVLLGLSLAQDFLKLLDLWKGWRYAFLFSLCVVHQHLDPIIKYYQLDEVDEE